MFIRHIIRSPPTLRFCLITLATLLAMAALAALGCWQLNRAAQKLAVQAAIEARQQWPALDNAQLLQAGDWQHRAVALHGQWLPEATVFLENRQMHGRVGFFVLTPLRLAGRQESVLVQRGWAARDFLERARLPEINTPAGTVTVTGRVAGEPARLYELGRLTQILRPSPSPQPLPREGGGAIVLPSPLAGEGPGVRGQSRLRKSNEFAPAAQESGFSRIRHNLDLSTYGAEFSLTLLPVTVVQTDADSEGLQRDWPKAGSGVEKHYGYAFQWFALCALVATLYVWFQLLRPYRQRPG